MVEQENETLRDRVADLEKRVHDQNDEITCMRATLADALRRINTLEAGKGQLEEDKFKLVSFQHLKYPVSASEHVQVNHRDVRLRRDVPDGGQGGGRASGIRRPLSGYHDPIGRFVTHFSLIHRGYDVWELNIL